MDLGIKGKRALVCASSKGLGRGCAEALAGAGVNLVLNSRGAEALEATAAEIRDSYGVDVVYKEKFGNKLSRTILNSDEVLKNMLLFRAPQATNFLLTENEASALINLTKSRDENPPAVGGHYV